MYPSLGTPALEEADSNTDEEFEPIAATHGRTKSDDFLKLNEDDR